MNFHPSENIFWVGLSKLNSFLKLLAKELWYVCDPEQVGQVPHYFAQISLALEIFIKLLIVGVSVIEFQEDILWFYLQLDNDLRNQNGEDRLKFGYYF